MKCMCPNCGKKVESGELCFDFTEFVHQKLKEKIILEEDSRKKISGCNTYFNKWKEQHLFMESENAVRDMEKVRASKETGIVYARYWLPYIQIMKKIEEQEEEEESEEQEEFREWMEENANMLKALNYLIWPQKKEDGDILFDSIKKTNGSDLAEVRHCPECYGVMSYWAGRYEEICLTVLGGPRVSKSTTLTACADAFMGNNRFIQWEGSSKDEAYKSFKEENLEIYREGEALVATDVQNDRIPRLSFRVKIGKKKICLTFIDLPGEFNGGKGVSVEIYRRYKYFYDNIDFIWYCTDPGEILQLVGSGKKLGYDKDDDIIDVDRLCENMADLASFFKYTERKEPVRVAYILGKTDTDVIDESDRKRYQLYNPTEKVNFLELDVENFWRQCMNVREYIDRYNYQLINCFDENFPDRCYIALSAYGYNPKSGKQVKAPYHRELPFLWMLALKSHIEIKVDEIGRKGREQHIVPLEELTEGMKKDVMHNLNMHSKGYRSSRM